jgi:magnesium-transporting ATPase (P-type)
MWCSSPAIALQIASAIEVLPVPDGPTNSHAEAYRGTRCAAAIFRLAKADIVRFLGVATIFADFPPFSFTLAHRASRAPRFYAVPPIQAANSAAFSLFSLTYLISTFAIWRWTTTYRRLPTLIFYAIRGLWGGSKWCVRESGARR